jgi:mannitol/fructose-specific phosphotransferase system IIA component (Ntr-type)
LGAHRFEGLDKELRSILIEKGLRSADPFDEVITRASVIFLPEKTNFEHAVMSASKVLAHHLPETEDQLAQRFLEGTRMGITPVTQGIALPHLRSAGIKRPELVLAQCRPGINIESDQNILCINPENRLIHAIFFLISPQEDPGQHLRILASIAGYAEDENFISNWLSATNEIQLKELFFKGKNFFNLHIRAKSKSASLIGIAIRDLDLPENCLVAFIHRSNNTIIPRGGTVLHDLDSVTFIGESDVINELYVKYG